MAERWLRSAPSMARAHVNAAACADARLPMIGMARRATPLIVLALLALRPPAGVSAQARSWMLGPFVKPPGVNPVITPQAATTFRSPVNDSMVRWEEYATFNPAAVVKDGRVYVLYRAEDASGEHEIGRQTSRI